MAVSTFHSDVQAVYKGQFTFYNNILLQSCRHFLLEGKINFTLFWRARLYLQKVWPFFGFVLSRTTNSKQSQQVSFFSGRQVAATACRPPLSNKLVEIFFSKNDFELSAPGKYRVLQARVALRFSSSPRSIRNSGRYQ